MWAFLCLVKMHCSFYPALSLLFIINLALLEHPAIVPKLLGATTLHLFH